MDAFSEGEGVISEDGGGENIEIGLGEGAGGKRAREWGQGGGGHSVMEIFSLPFIVAFSLPFFIP